MEPAIDEATFPCMGTEMRIVVEEDGPGGTGAQELLAGSREALLAHAREALRELDARLTRFDSGSELSALNAAAESVVPASRCLRRAVAAALWAARRSDGLVDPTVIGALEEAGYDRPMGDDEPASLREALRLAPARRPAAPGRDSRWREIAVDDEGGTISRPPGVRLDLGGTAKGLAADLMGARLARFRRWAVDCGGDLAVGGSEAGAEPHQVAVDDPFSGEIAGIVEVERGGVATSGVDVRLWRGPDGRPRHHLIDPSTGSPAWTGVVAATALGGSALEAEVLSKAALLLGPRRARHVLQELGGVVVTDDGRMQQVGPIRIAWMWTARPADRG